MIINGAPSLFTFHSQFNFIVTLPPPFCKEKLSKRKTLCVSHNKTYLYLFKLPHRIEQSKAASPKHK